MYTRAWAEGTPLGTELADTLDTIIQNDKIDTRERIADILGIADFTTDPVIPTLIRLNRTTNSKILGGTTSLSLRNSADTFDNLHITDAGNITVRGSITGVTSLGGTLTTAAQPNITSLGTLTGLTVNGGFYNLGLPVARFETNGNAPIGGTGVGIEIYKGGIQAYNRSTLAVAPFQFDASAFTFNGNAVFSGTITGTIATAAQPNITSLGTLNSTLNSTAAAVINGSGQAASYQYIQLTNTSGNVILGIESSAGGSLVVGSSAYAAVIHTSGAKSLHFGTNNTVRQTIDSAGNVVFTGTVTAANFVGPTSIDANNLTGTTLASNVVNSSLTSVGTLNGLNISGVINSTTLGLLYQASGATTVLKYLELINTGGHLYWGIEGSGGGQILGGTAGYDVSFNNAANTAIRFGVNNALVVSITTAGLVGNVTGNLTGTVLTAAQGNITSLGTLSSLTVSGTATIGGATSPVLINRLSNSATYGAISFSGALDSTAPGFVGIYGRATDTYLNIQAATVNVTGAVTFLGAGGIHVAGASVFDSTISATGVTLGNGQYYKGTRTSGALVINLLGIEAGTDRTIMTHTGDFVIQDGSNNANFTMTTAGAVALRSTLSGITTLTATSIFGTLATAAQTNITSVGGLTALSVVGDFSHSGSNFSILGNPTSFGAANSGGAGFRQVIVPN